MRKRLVSGLRRFAQDEQGGMTIFSVFMFATCCAIGAIALDVTHFYAARTQLQVAADVGAHAALFTRHNGRTEAEAKTAAIAVASYGFPASQGTILSEADIVFGDYTTTDGFTPLQTGSTALPSAARVVTNRADDNPVGSFLFRIVGVDSMDVRASAVYTTHQPACFRDGFVAQGVVRVDSGNQYRNCFCIHSNTSVTIAQNNTFEQCATVSMPDLDDLNIADSGFQMNSGLQEALRENRQDLSILDLIRPSAGHPNGEFWDAFQTQDHIYRPSYITSSQVQTIQVTATRDVSPSQVVANQVNHFNCSDPNNQTLNLRASGNNTALFTNVVIITNCKLGLHGRTSFDNAILYTTNTASNSVQTNSAGNQALNLGIDDGCKPGRSSKLITRGGVIVTASLRSYGSQILALGNVTFHAQAQGVGTSIVSDGIIAGTSQMNFSGCGNAGDHFIITRFRLAQ